MLEWKCAVFHGQQVLVLILSTATMVLMCMLMYLCKLSDCPARSGYKHSEDILLGYKMLHYVCITS